MPDTHLDEEQLFRLLHGELAAPEASMAREHLAGCARCGDRLAEARREEETLGQLLRRVDHPAPRLSADAIATRAGAHAVRPLRWAAVAVLGLGLVGAAYALPASPLRGWIKSITAWMTGGRSRPLPVAEPAPAPPAAGIAFPPGERTVIVFTRAQALSEVRVSLTDGTDVVVRAPTGAATFNSQPDRLVIDNRDQVARFEIEVPRAAPWIEIRVGGAGVWRKEGARITPAPPQDSQQPYRIPLSP